MNFVATQAGLRHVRDGLLKTIENIHHIKDPHAKPALSSAESTLKQLDDLMRHLGDAHHEHSEEESHHHTRRKR